MRRGPGLRPRRPGRCRCRSGYRQLGGGERTVIAADWCHFTQRLPRSRAHKQLKSAELPFEDEKFIYVALSRAPAPPRRARVLAEPVATKIAITAKLCTDAGIRIAAAP